MAEATHSFRAEKSGGGGVWIGKGSPVSFQEFFLDGRGGNPNLVTSYNDAWLLSVSLVKYKGTELSKPFLGYMYRVANKTTTRKVSWTQPTQGKISVLNLFKLVGTATC